jgi:preprotein translocase subunit YajC
VGSAKILGAAQGSQVGKGNKLSKRTTFGATNYNRRLTICDCTARLWAVSGFVSFVLWSAPVFISTAFAQTTAAAGGSMQDSLMSMLPLVLMFVVLYFVMIRPQMKKQKEHKAMIDAIAKGDEVVTAGGVLGKVSKIGDSYVGLEVANGVEIQIQRSAVVQVLPKGTYK